MGVPVNLGSMIGIQQHLAALPREIEKLASCFTEGEQRLAEEAAKAAVMRAAQRAQGELRKRGEVAKWISRMS